MKTARYWKELCMNGLRKLKVARQAWNMQEQDVHQPLPLTRRLRELKGYANCFLGFKRPILEDYLENGSTVNSARYCDMLAISLKPEIRTKRRGLLSKKVLLLHANAHPHTARKTIETVDKLSFEVLQHPANSPDVPPLMLSTFHPRCFARS